MQALHLSELMSALSHALDITEGQPEGHCVRCCWIGMHTSANRHARCAASKWCTALQSAATLRGIHFGVAAAILLAEAHGRLCKPRI